MGAIENEKVYGLTIRESATDGSDFTNPDADYRRLFLGEDGQLHVKDSAGAVSDIGAGSGGSTVLSPSSDTFLDSQNATTNNDTATAIQVGNAWGTSSFTRFALLTFDVSALAGKTITSAILYLYRTDNTAAGATDRRLEARRILRAYVAAEVTWNIYSSGNNWATAGAAGTGTDQELARTQGDDVGAAADVDQWHAIDLTPLLQATIDAAETTFRVKIGANVNGAGSNAVQFASLNHATAGLRPKLRVTHT
jgi:hypothetical protein